ncbi:hypothetical protein D3C73_1426040 [compost metagenome]
MPWARLREEGCFTLCSNRRKEEEDFAAADAAMFGKVPDAAIPALVRNRMAPRLAAIFLVNVVCFMRAPS